jgi:hypothetical protein
MNIRQQLFWSAVKPRHKTIDNFKNAVRAGMAVIVMPALMFNLEIAD